MADRTYGPFSETADLIERELARLQGAQSHLAAQQSRPAVSARELPGAIRARVKLFARTVRFEIEVPGQHYSGLSNDALLEILANQGRDFLDNTSVPLKQAMERAMLESFDGFPHVPTLLELRKEHTKQLKLYIANERFNGGGDQKLRKLTPAYAAWKRKKVGLKPIGVLRGKLLGAFRKSGRVNYL